MRSRNTSVEPWLRGTLQDVPPVARAVLHAFELAGEDLEKWCGGLSDAELHARPGSIASVAFHLRHIAGSLDRLLTGAEGEPLRDEQFATKNRELEATGTRDELFRELRDALARGADRVRALAAKDYGEQRAVGRKRLPTTLGGLLVHCADHTQRHVGQAITTAKIVLAARNQ